MTEFCRRHSSMNGKMVEGYIEALLQPVVYAWLEYNNLFMNATTFRRDCSIRLCVYSEEPAKVYIAFFLALRSLRIW
jgi:hypothetical protein